MSTNRDSTKVKVIVGFTVAVGMIVFAIYLTYSSFTRLLGSLDVLSQPNIKLVKLQHTLASMASAESSIRAYTLTTDEKYFRTYLSNLDTIRSQIDSLRMYMAANPTELAQVDSIASLLQTKKQSLKQYVELKKLQNRNDYYAEKALSQIASAATKKPASTTIRQRTTTTTVIPGAPPATDSTQEQFQEQEPQEEKKGFFNKLFSKKSEKDIKRNKPPKVLIPELNVTNEIEVDTNTASTGKVADLNRIKRILSQVQREANRDEQQLTSKALGLLRQDKQIMDQIRTMMYGLEQYELHQSRQRSQLARQNAKLTSRVLLIIGIVGLISGVAFILLILRDLTRSNHYKSRLIRAQKDAVQLARAKEAFVANMSHEMRTPLNVILGFTQQLTHTDLQPQQTEHLQAINGAGQHLLHIVNDVLDLSKIEAGKFNINRSPFQLSQMLTEVEQAFALKASSKGVRFSCKQDEKLPNALEGDVLRIKQVLFNLVDNAIKFTHQGTIEVEAFLKSQRRSRVVACITVTDTGIGIPAERLGHIFGEFNQADDSILRKYGGTGLGLSISKKLVEMQGGTMAVESTEGKGTTFKIMLPLLTVKQAPVEAAPAAPAQPHPQAFTGLKALVIDDDAYSRTLCELILCRWGMEVYLANDGQEALLQAERVQFDIVLTDMQLPGMSGKVVARAIRKIDAAVPIMALTANILGNDSDFFDNTPIVSYLLKPFTEQELYAKLADLLPPVAAAPGQPAASPAPKLASNESPGTDLYSLTEIQQFTGADTDTLLAVLEVMLEDQKLNLAQLHQAQQEKDWNSAASIAHKMLTAFKHLHASTVTPGLEALEQSLRQGTALDADAQLSPLIEHVRQEAARVLQALGAVVEQLRAAATTV